MVYINTWGLVDPSAPFGGFKASGHRPRARPRRPGRLPGDQDGLDRVVSRTALRERRRAERTRGPAACRTRALGASARRAVRAAAGRRRDRRDRPRRRRRALGADPQIASASPAGCRGIGERLGYRVFLIALLVCVRRLRGRCCCSPAAASVRAISTRSAIVLIAALQLIVFVGPILLSTDVFSYIAYARMGVEHGLNPYLHGPVGDRAATRSSSTSATTGSAWPPPTGRCTRCSPIRSRRSAWWARCGAMKLEALLASAGTLALTWRCARARGLRPGVRRCWSSAPTRCTSSTASAAPTTT